MGRAARGAHLTDVVVSGSLVGIIRSDPSGSGNLGRTPKVLTCQRRDVAAPPGCNYVSEAPQVRSPVVGAAGGAVDGDHGPDPTITQIDEP